MATVMFQGLLVRVLQAVLGSYVKFDPERLQLGIWSGELVLEKLQLLPGALDRFELPAQVVAGHVRSVRIVIPWANIWNAPVKVSIDGVYAIVVPSEFKDFDQKAAAQFARSIKQAQITSANETRILRNAAMQKDFGIEAKKQESMMSNLVTTVLNNLQVSIKNVHLRYEDQLSVSGSKALRFAFGVHVSEFVAETTDKEGRKVFISTSDSPVSFKAVQLSQAAIYWDNNCTFYHEDSDAVKLLMDSLKESSLKHDYVVPSFTATLKCSLNTRLQDLRSPKLKLSLTVENFAIMLEKGQYAALLLLLNRISKIRLKADVAAGMSMLLLDRRYDESAPEDKSVSRSRAFSKWMYAFKCIRAVLDSKKKQNYSWTYILSRIRMRKDYLKVYRESCIKGTSVKQDIKETMLTLEDALDVESIMIFRQLVDSKLELESALLEKKKKSKENQYQWWNPVGYMVKVEDEKVVSLSEEEKAELLSRFSSDAVVTKLPPDFVRLSFDVILHRSTINLSIGCKVFTDLTLSATCSFKILEDNGSTFTAAVQELGVVDRTCDVKSLVFFQLQNSDSDDGEKFLEFFYSQNLNDENVVKELRLSSLSGTGFVYRKQWISRIQEFFLNRDVFVDTAQVDNDHEFLDATLSSWKHARQMELLDTLSNRSRVSVHVQFQNIVVCMMLADDDSLVASLKALIITSSVSQYAYDSMELPESRDSKYYDEFAFVAEQFCLSCARDLTSTNLYRFRDLEHSPIIEESGLDAHVSLLNQKVLASAQDILTFDSNLESLLVPYFLNIRFHVIKLHISSHSLKVLLKTLRNFQGGSRGEKLSAPLVPLKKPAEERSIESGVSRSIHFRASIRSSECSLDVHSVDSSNPLSFIFKYQSFVTTVSHTTYGLHFLVSLRSFFAWIKNASGIQTICSSSNDSAPGLNLVSFSLLKAATGNPEITLACGYIGIFLLPRLLHNLFTVFSEFEEAMSLSGLVSKTDTRDLSSVEDASSHSEIVSSSSFSNTSSRFPNFSFGFKFHQLVLTITCEIGLQLSIVLDKVNVRLARIKSDTSASFCINEFLISCPDSKDMKVCSLDHLSECPMLDLTYHHSNVHDLVLKISGVSTAYGLREHAIIRHHLSNLTEEFKSLKSNVFLNDSEVISDSKETKPSSLLTLMDSMFELRGTFSFDVCKLSFCWSDIGLNAAVKRLQLNSFSVDESCSFQVILNDAVLSYPSSQVLSVGTISATALRNRRKALTTSLQTSCSSLIFHLRSRLCVDVVDAFSLNISGKPFPELSLEVEIPGCSIAGEMLGTQLKQLRFETEGSSIFFQSSSAFKALIPVVLTLDSDEMKCNSNSFQVLLGDSLESLDCFAVVNNLKVASPLDFKMISIGFDSAKLSSSRAAHSRLRSCIDNISRVWSFVRSSMNTSSSHVKRKHIEEASPGLCILVDGQSLGICWHSSSDLSLNAHSSLLSFQITKSGFDLSIVLSLDVFQNISDKVRGSVRSDQVKLLLKSDVGKGLHISVASESLCSVEYCWLTVQEIVDFSVSIGSIFASDRIDHDGSSKQIAEPFKLSVDVDIPRLDGKAFFQFKSDLSICSISAGELKVHYELPSASLAVSALTARAVDLESEIPFIEFSDGLSRISYNQSFAAPFLISLSLDSPRLIFLPLIVRNIVGHFSNLNENSESSDDGNELAAEPSFENRFELKLKDIGVSISDSVSPLVPRF
jgi:hypothetical protein